MAAEPEVPENRRSVGARIPSGWGGLFGSVRVRTTVAALVVVALTLGVGGAALVWFVHRSLIDGLVGSATSEASSVGALMSEQPSSNDLPLRTGIAVQVVDAEGRVIAHSPDLGTARAVTDVRPAVGQSTVLTVPSVLPGNDTDGNLTAALTVDSPRGPLTVYALVSDDQAERSTHQLAFVLALTLPLLVVVSGLLAWRLAGRALRPVEAIRAEVSDISARDLHRRVPTPPWEDEIGRLALTMNAMLSRLESASDRQRQFVSDASHELRSPLASLLTQVEVARAHPESADWTAVSKVVTEEGARLSRIIDDLLLLARMDEGMLVPRRDLVDLDELVFTEASRLRAQHRIGVDLHAVGAGRVSGDDDQLRRVVRNLADNAERHARSTVSFEVSRENGHVALAVADDGPGVPADQRERIFERFARLDEARGRTVGGTGLGLAIVGELVALHGGSVRVADAPVGARFVVELPAYEEPVR